MECETCTVTIKVGVARTTLARHRGKRIESIHSSPTPLLEKNSGEWMTSMISALLGRKTDKSVDGALVCVVPELSGTICRVWKQMTGGDLRLFEPESAPFSVAYRPPETLGRDRSAAIWGALERFGEELGNSFMVADFGTHTVTTVFHDGGVLGGAIAPGLGLQRKEIGGGRISLAAAPSEQRVLEKIVRFHGMGGIGRSTAEAIEMGIVLGAVGGVESLRKRAELQLKSPVRLVLTGGFSCLIAPLFSPGFLLNRQLVHYGAWKFLSCS